MKASLIAIAVLAVSGAGVQAADLDPITVSAPVVKSMGRDMFAADRQDVEEDSACVHDAVKAAEPQVTAAIANAREASAAS